MKILVTGANGFVGSAVVQDLLQAGHKVIGLVRSAAAAATLTALGAEAAVADLRQRDALREAVSGVDGVIHTAFNHDFSRFMENCEADGAAITLMGEELAGSGRPLVIASAIGVLPKAGIVTEADAPVPAGAPGRNPRALSEEVAQRVAATGVPVSSVRLPLSVHGAGDHAFVPALIGIARQRNLSAYVGAGDNHWPAVHRRDAARLFRLAVEAGAADAQYHAVAEEGVPFRQIAEAIGKGLNVPVGAVAPEEAAAHFTWFEHFAEMNVMASSAETRRVLGWDPTGPALLSDLEEGGYFDA
ncbi:MAG: SDR family oxidoreductase [Rhodobacteraceae bacterium]|nr:SDR family oxidoreductase [Paracoccaceae bacterium]MBR9821003.1 SDR family oxidoreductase [Paracoccaceae bacterium]